MKNILEAPFIKEMQSACANMYRLGWDERNGGNISYLIPEEDAAEYVDINNVIREIPISFTAPELVGKIFLVTGTGKYFKNVMGDPDIVNYSLSLPLYFITYKKLRLLN